MNVLISLKVSRIWGGSFPSVITSFDSLYLIILFQNRIHVFDLILAFLTNYHTYLLLDLISKVLNF